MFNDFLSRVFMNSTSIPRFRSPYLQRSNVRHVLQLRREVFKAPEDRLSAAAPRHGEMFPTLMISSLLLAVYIYLYVEIVIFFVVITILICSSSSSSSSSSCCSCIICIICRPTNAPSFRLQKDNNCCMMLSVFKMCSHAVTIFHGVQMFLDLYLIKQHQATDFNVAMSCPQGGALVKVNAKLPNMIAITGDNQAWWGR